jgi:alpha-L-rhamnosidase
MWLDANGTASNWSSLASFDTGYLSQSDWSGKWIGGSGNLLRKDFSLSATPTRGRVYVSGIGYYVLYINGQRVGDAYLDVGWTDYSKRALYNAYDVTSLLVNGANAIGVMQGHGWYASTEAREPNGPMSLMLQLSVNGQLVLVSDSTWSVAPGPVVYDGVYNGETYDTRLEQPGWALAGFSQGSSWTSATALTAPGGVLTYQAIPPVRELVVLSPKKITQPQEGVYVIDFGQNLSGWGRITVAGPTGSNVTLRHAEVLLPDGSGLIYTANLRSAKATDVYILNGTDTPAVYEPHFTYHGFRYIEWTASDPSLIPTMDNIVSVHAYSDVPQTGAIEFEASSNILNMIQHNILWGQASNLMSVPTDCDQRDERKGWMGDAQLSAEEAIHNYYMPAFYTNFIQVIEDEQNSAGAVADTSPWTFGGEPSDPAWGSAYPSILYWTWKYYDDIELVERHYANIKLYMEFLYSQYNKTGLANYYYTYGDWVPPPPFSMCSSHVTSSFSFLANVGQFIEMAAATGNSGDAATFTALQTKINAEFNSAFFNANYDYYDTGLQTAQALPLWLNIVPQSAQRNFTINLLNDIITTQRTHLTTGIIGTKYLMLALHNIGRDDVALQLAENFDYPSWGYMAVHPTEPATTLWELWDSPDGNPGMDSRNHIMFGSVGDWFYKALAGIDHPTSDAGFAQFNIAPSVVGDLTEVYATFAAGYGNISVGWQRTGGSMLCGSAPEGHILELDCASIGSTGVIEEITFASFGLPHGTCGAFGENEVCSAPKAQFVVESQCVGKSSCSFLAHEDVLGSAFCGTQNVFKRAHVQAKCSQAAPSGFSLQADIPVGSSANVVIPALDLSQVTVTVNGATVWTNDKFQATSGVSQGTLVGNTINFVTGSGTYEFELSGNPGTVVCANTTENNDLTIACPSGQIITQVQFASYGDPAGECGALLVGSCNAGSSKYMTEQLCLLQSSCTIDVSDATFLDPCYGTPKAYAAQVVCASI